MSFALNQFTGFGVPSSLFPEASASWSFASNESLTDDSGTYTADFEIIGNGTVTNTSKIGSDGEMDYHTADGANPRWDYFPTGDNNPRGLMIEQGEASIASPGSANDNHIDFSYELNSNSWWAESGVSINGGETDPAGGTDAYAHIPSGSSNVKTNTSSSMNISSISVGDDVFFSIFFKSGDTNARYFMLSCDTGAETTRHVIDSQNQTFTDEDGSYVDRGIEDYGNGWYRVWVLATAATQTSGMGFIYYFGDGPDIADHTGAWAGNGSDEIIMYGAHIGVDAPMAYKHCTVDDVNHIGDKFKLDTSTDIPNFDEDKGTLYAYIELRYGTDNWINYVFSVDNDTNNTDYFLLSMDGRDGYPAVSCQLREGGSLRDSFTRTQITQLHGNFYKIAMTWDSTADELKVYVNGLLIDTLTSGGNWPGAGDLTNIGLARLYTGSTRGSIWVREFKYWDSAIKEDHAKFLTTINVQPS